MGSLLNNVHYHVGSAWILPMQERSVGGSATDYLMYF